MKARLRGLALGLAVVCGTMMSLPTPSRADVISTFDLSGNFGLPNQLGFQVLYTLSGSVTVDTTTGVVQSQTVFPPLSPALPATFMQGFDTGAQAYFLNLNGTIRLADIFFDTASLVNYAGGNLGSLAFPTAGGGVSSYSAQLLPNNIVLQSGIATLELVPEPGSTALFVAGLSFLALMSRSRKSN